VAITDGLPSQGEHDQACQQQRDREQHRGRQETAAADVLQVAAEVWAGETAEVAEGVDQAHRTAGQRHGHDAGRTGHVRAGCEQAIFRGSVGCGTRASERCCAALDNGLVIEVEPGRFEEMVVTALDGLPEELGRLMRNVAVTVEHGPGPPGLLGLYEGIPLTSRTSEYAGVLPDRITIYRQAICAIGRTEQEVADQVRRTVIHEIAHHFGIDDNRLSELGW
jgi:predicted Zn-dependent protease with MMP-like domain